MGFKEITMNRITNLWLGRINYSKNTSGKRNPLQWSETLPDLPDSTVTNILLFDQSINTALMKQDISKDLLHIYKETIVNKLNVTKEMVDRLENSNITKIFHMLNDESTESALTMGFSLKQIATIPSNQLSEYRAQFDAYSIPLYIQNQIDNLSETNGQLNLENKGLKTGELCKILNSLTDDQRNYLTHLNLNGNQLTLLPDSFGNLRALTDLQLFNNKLTSLPDSFGNLRCLRVLYLSVNKLTSLPDSFGNLSLLSTLALHENQLRFLPDSLENLSALKYLNLERNQLKSLPHSLGTLSALRTLLLKKNAFNYTQKRAIQQRFNFAKL